MNVISLSRTDEDVCFKFFMMPACSRGPVWFCSLQSFLINDHVENKLDSSLEK